MQTSAACLVALGISLPCCGAARAGEVYHGRVVAVSDGHTLVALVDHRRVEVRIAGIEAPVEGRRHAIASRQSLIAICGGEPVRIEAQARLPGGGLVARVLCNGLDAAGEQVRRGMATAVISPDAAAGGLDRLQSDARAAKRGVWSGVQPPAAGR